MILSPWPLFFLGLLLLAIVILLNYYIIGEIDRLAGGLTRLDPFFQKFDLVLFGKPVWKLLEELTISLGPMRSVFYNLLMYAYFTYYLIPILGGVLIFRELPLEEKTRIGRYLGSVVIYFSVNYLFYLLIPVTGPQFSLDPKTFSPIPFGPLGTVLYESIQNAQTTFIDCFPSGHVGISFLVTIWLFRTDHIYRYFFLLITFFIIFATLGIRYHYFLDVFFAFPLALFCYGLGHMLVPLSLKPQTLRLSE